jgi:TetR/AcrR family transcriptional regulator
VHAVSPKPTPDERIDPRRRRTLGLLLRAAEEMFGERSADEVTVEQIAERAGVAVSSIYNHFGSKAGLHAAVVGRALDVDRQYMDRAYTDDRTPIEQIAAASEEYLRFYIEHPDYFRLLAFPPEPGQYEAGRELAQRLAQRVDEQNSRLADALRHAIQTGLVRAVDPEQAATFLWAAWNGLISLAWRPDALRRDTAQLHELLTAATDLVALGLLPRSGEPEVEAV